MNADRKLEAVLGWIDRVDGQPATTVARFAIHLDELPIWPVWGDEDTDLEIFVDDLLAYLTTYWDELLLQQVYPHGLNPVRPSLLQAAAERAVANGPRSAEGGDLMTAVMSFAAGHDLARCFGGLYNLPAFWSLRQGQDVLIETSDRLERVPLGQWLAFASNLGDTIAARLLKTDSGKWQVLVDAWEARDRGDPVRIAALSTGQSVGVASKLIEEHLVPVTASIGEAANDDDSLRIAARMIGAIPYHAIRTVLTAAKAVPHQPSRELDQVREQLAEAMEELRESAYPYEQGVFAANWIRRHLKLNLSSRCDPVATLDRYGVALSQQNIGPSTLDALAIWGNAHGPAVIINVGSKRLGGAHGKVSRRGLKISVAHEICHLVLDYRKTLAAVDIFGSRIPIASERRANAFAAEFLLPAQTAVAIWRSSNLALSRDGLSTFLDRLSDRFDVSRILAGWQLDHGLAGSNPEIVFLLDELLDRQR